MFLRFVTSQRLYFAKSTYCKLSDCLLLKRISLNLTENSRTYVRNDSKIKINKWLGNGNKYFYMVTAGCLLAFAESLRRCKPSLVPCAHASSSSLTQNPKSWNFIADVVEKTAPAVVYIEIIGKHPFTGKSVAVANGSGFIVRSDGLVLTNAHVVGNCKSVKVRLSDGTQKTGLVQAIDVVSDLATVKISGKNLPTLNLGKSNLLRPGEFVVAMGSPLQLSNTVTAGIVSSANRKSEDLGLQNKGLTYIQTDANINYGNSGGPLVNLDGEAIGINTMTVTNGISFAIPSDFAREFLERAAELEKSKKKDESGKLLTKEQIQDKKFIGITMITLTPELVNTLKLQHWDLMNVDHGVLVYRVIPGSPADNGGIKPGDIIITMNEKRMESSVDVFNAINSSTEDLNVVVVRGRDSVPLSIKPEIVC